MKIEVKNDYCLPYRAHDYDAGLDLRNAGKDVKIYPYDSAIIYTGVKVEIPKNHTGMIVPRSSLGARGLALKNTIGIIDSEYRGEIKVYLQNKGSEPIDIKQYDRFVQLLIIPIVVPTVEIVDSVSNTKRGTGGFGSSGAT